MNFNGQLPNGVELYTCENPNIGAFCLSLWVRRGSMHEPEECHGLAHFLEHAIFRSISERMGGGLYRRLAELGLCFDACTYVNFVRFEISGPPERLNDAADILMMALDAPELSLDGIALERGRVRREIWEERAEDSADYFANGVAWRGTRLARTIAGTAHSVSLIGFEVLKREHARWFSRGNFFFCATGRIGDAGYLRERLGALKIVSGPPVAQAAPVPERFHRRDAEIELQDGETAWVRFCFDVDAARYPEAVHMLMTEYLLGDLGRLYLSLSEDRALVYNLNDCYERFSNIGSLNFDYEIDKKHLMETLEVVAGELNAAKKMDAAAFEACRRCFIMDDRIKRDHVCTFDYLWGYDNGIKGCGFESAADRERAYLDVKVEAMREMAGEVFRPENLSLCLRANERHVDREGIRSILMRLG